VEEPYRRIALELVSGNQDLEPYKLKIISNSMFPMLRSGDVVIVKPRKPGESMQRGDIIVFRQFDADDSGLPLTHRLIGRSSAGWLTKGDFRLLPDVPLEPQALLGKVIAYQRGERRVDLDHPGWQFANLALGWLHFSVGILMSGANCLRKLFDRR
jgi:hypothetical protein